MIEYNEQNRIFHITTDNTSYLIQILKSGHPAQLYYGRRIKNHGAFENFYRETTVICGSTTSYSRETPGFSLDLVCLENAAWGKGDYRSPSIMLRDSRGDRTFDFLYKGHRLSKGKEPIPGLPASLAGKDGGVKTLELELLDAARQTALILVYAVFPGTDVITRSVRVENRGTETLTLEKVMSVNMDFSTSRWDLTTLDGAWIRERHPHTAALRPGMTSVSSRRGLSSSNHSPFLILQDPDATELSGDCYGFALTYSGNHQSDAEVSPHGFTRVQMGINSFDFSWQLEGGEVFHAPEAVLTFSHRGKNGLSRQLHRFVRDHIVRGHWQYKERPVLINNWEATYFDFDEEKLLALAKEAGDAGIELFVLDDGWFGRRNDDTSSLGDWQVDETKLPGGLKSLGDKIRKIGLDFGLWVEPEMVSLDSNLYRRHPDWMIRSPSLEPSPGRHQYILDLTREDVREYLFEALQQVFRSGPISYVKWDMNRNFSDLYSQKLPAQKQQEFQHRYVLGLYELLEKLNRAFPEILFESCASGGNRFDLGMLCYMPQVWTSDNTDGWERLPIQSGSSLFAPPSVMAAHVSTVPNHQVMRETPLETRFNTAAFGLLGYELDLTKLDEAEKRVIKEQVRFYKEHRKLLQFGEFLRLEDPEEQREHTWMCVSPDGTEAMLGWYQALARPNPGLRRIRLAGLQEDGFYRLISRPQFLDTRRLGDLINQGLPIGINADGIPSGKKAGNFVCDLEKTATAAYGDQLMYRGFEPIRQFFGTGIDENVSYLGDFGSRLYHLKRIDPR